MREIVALAAPVTVAPSSHTAPTAARPCTAGELLVEQPPDTTDWSIDGPDDTGPSVVCTATVASLSLL